MKKIVLFAFNGELMCFAHVLLNALDMNERGHEARVVFEGSSVGLIPGLEKEDGQFHGLYKKAKDKGLVAGACKGCSVKLGVDDAVKKAGLPLLEGIMGHPSMAQWMDDGYTIITF